MKGETAYETVACSFEDGKVLLVVRSGGRSSGKEGKQAEGLGQPVAPLSDTLRRLKQES